MVDIDADAEPRVLDTLLAEAMGLARPTNIRSLIEANRTELETFGGLHSARANTSDPLGRGRPSTAYYLNEEQALLIVTRTRTEAGRKLRAELIRVFVAWRRGNLAPAIPDFGNPAEAARA